MAVRNQKAKRCTCRHAIRFNRTRDRYDCTWCEKSYTKEQAALIPETTFFDIEPTPEPQGSASIEMFKAMVRPAPAAPAATVSTCTPVNHYDLRDDR